MEKAPSTIVHSKLWNETFKRLGHLIIHPIEPLSFILHYIHILMDVSVTTYQNQLYVSTRIKR